MFKTLLCMVMGYSFGCINPAAALAVRKKKNLREIGTKNLGATNAAVAFGKKYGVLVMVIDILKSFISVKLARILFPQLYIAGLVAGSSAVMGHIFPVQMKFKGGKGLAAFGGLILAFDPMMFLMLLVIGLVLIIVTGYGTALPLSAPMLAPLIGGWRHHSMSVFVVLLAVGCVMIYKHWENVAAITEGTEPKAREFIQRHINKKED